MPASPVPEGPTAARAPPPAYVLVCVCACVRVCVCERERVCVESLRASGAALDTTPATMYAGHYGHQSCLSQHCGPSDRPARPAHLSLFALPAPKERTGLPVGTLVRAAAGALAGRVSTQKRAAEAYPNHVRSHGKSLRAEIAETDMARRQPLR